MEYRRIFYRESVGESGCYPFAYQVNFVMGEGSISYCNRDGGFTTRGAKLNENVLSHFRLLLGQAKPEQFRDGKNLKIEKGFFVDEFSWEFIVEYTDGTSELRIDNSRENNPGINEIVKVPAFITELRGYAIAQLGLVDLR